METIHKDGQCLDLQPPIASLSAQLQQGITVCSASLSNNNNYVADDESEDESLGGMCILS